MCKHFNATTERNKSIQSLKVYVQQMFSDIVFMQSTNNQHYYYKVLQFIVLILQCLLLWKNNSCNEEKKNKTEKKKTSYKNIDIVNFVMDQWGSTMKYREFRKSIAVSENVCRGGHFSTFFEEFIKFDLTNPRFSEAFLNLNKFYNFSTIFFPNNPHNLGSFYKAGVKYSLKKFLVLRLLI